MTGHERSPLPRVQPAEVAARQSTSTDTTEKIENRHEHRNQTRPKRTPVEQYRRCHAVFVLFTPDDTLEAHPRQVAVANKQNLGASATHFGGCEQDRGREGASSLAMALVVSDRLPARVSMAPRCEAARPSRGVPSSVARPCPRPVVILRSRPCCVD